MGNRWATGSIALALALGTGVATGAPAQAQAPAAVTATKAVTGPFVEGGTVTYTITLVNSGGVASPDNPTDELVDVLPTGLTLVSATASSGVPTADATLGQVTWNGAITVGTPVTITISAVIQQGTEGDDLLNQAEVRFDADGNGSNEATVLTDGDAVTAGQQPTVLSVAAIAPTVTIEQALIQPDPAPNEPVRFTVEFSEPVSGFDGNDVVRSGTAGATNALVTGTVPGASYTVIVTGATAPGTVIASIPAGVALDDDGNANEASTSVDNEVTLTAIGTTTTTTSLGTTTSTAVVLPTTSTTAAVAATGSLPRTGSDEDGPLVAFLGYWVALGGVGAVGLAGLQRRRARSSSS